MSRRLELFERHKHHLPKTEDTARRHEMINEASLVFALTIDDLVPDGRERSRAQVKIEEARSWANAAVARNPAVAAQKTLPQRGKPVTATWLINYALEVVHEIENKLTRKITMARPGEREGLSMARNFVRAESRKIKESAQMTDPQDHDEDEEEKVDLAQQQGNLFESIEPKENPSNATSH